MNDVSLEPEWQPALREASQDPPGPTRVGTERSYVSSFMGRPVKNTYVVTEYDEDRRVVMSTTDASTLRVTTELSWEPTPEGTRVSMTVDGAPKGALKLIPAKVLEAKFEEELADALARLKERLERSG